mmetsp:Transcript_91190/g.162391  ORF Transcript_91190/g.162391 Transcript_91190/m.162391 type:complete len:1119 (+) Transcript_91190:76-3432(+)
MASHFRNVTFNQQDASIVDNKVVTAHYTAANFVPKNLMEQFSKAANLYFLFLSGLQVTPKVTTTGGIPTIGAPLFLIVTLNAAKDALEDWRRHKSDREENERKCLCVTGSGASAKLEEKNWSDLRVGSMVVVRNNEYVPADMVIVTTAHEQGHAYIETANLDGETNLKTKQAPKAAFDLLKGTGADKAAAVAKCCSIDWKCECELPNEFLYTFAGNVTAKGSAGEEKIPLDEQHILLRGCKVKNVQWALGSVVYTGKETKILMNSKEKVGRKVSHLESTLNKIVLIIFLFQSVLCLIGGLSAAMFETDKNNFSKMYLPLTDAEGNALYSFIVVLLIRYFNFMILFSNFIPISLLVSMSIAKVIQIFFFYADKDMIYKGINCMPRTSDLNDELGQIEYVFSDKTGTLTQNVMDFRKFCVDGVSYGQGVTEIKRQVMFRKGLPVTEPPPPPPDAKKTSNVDLVDPVLDELLKNKSGGQYEKVKDFFFHLAVNHEVVPEVDDNGAMSGYSASSPDEAALCYGANHHGWKFLGKDTTGMTVETIDGSKIKVQVLAQIKFTSARKKSSVIVQYTQDGKEYLKLLTKGADSAIISRLEAQYLNSPETKQSMETLKEFAEDGLRTLCLASRQLTRSEVDDWLQKWNVASLATENRQDKMDEVSDLLEVNLTMDGITGIEDRLQDEVGETIIKMVEAGIKVWMLTGDKTETAINIGIATGLLEAEAGSKGERPEFSTPDFEDAEGKFKPTDMTNKLKTVAAEARQTFTKGDMFEGMVMDGKCLEIALQPENEKDFVAICKVCRTVICCRVTPKQKGAVVRLIKAEEKAITLAIGDGANDCNMIMSADVGIGIRGLEGLQAFNVCDYGISQFRFLQYLLLVHGRWCYRRVAILCNYMFYKNFVVVLPQYFLGLVSGFSGQKLYHDALYQSYNVFFTFLPIMVFGVIDQDVSKRVSLLYPELYKAGLQGLYWNVKVSAGWIASGIWHAMCCFFVPYIVMANGNITHSDGKANDIWGMGFVILTLVCIVTNVVVLMETYYWHKLVTLGMGLTIFAYLSGNAMITGVMFMMSSNLYGTMFRMLFCPMIMAVILVGTLCAVMVDIHIKGLQCCYFPSIMHKVQEKVIEKKI